MDQIHNLDWLVAGILAYGVVAGMVRGFLQQFTRLFALIGALLLASSWNPLTHWLATVYSDQAEISGRVQADVELLIFLLAFVALLLLRRTILGWLGSPAGADARAAGALSGLVGVVLLSSLVLGHQKARMPHEDFSELFFTRYLHRPTVAALSLLPSSLVPSIVFESEHDESSLPENEPLLP
ncbi:MAG: CvpA family protein [Planctomycetes bacterium]|jgi:uncharacterized membrane protein required for colicin V production|nr:CvpA family protein [Planctomycetota bacterium]MBT4029650.1 CvpA family protein [Planctomycetota bacterium]MBT5101098.1 CvpA family protein [Planctomycetota bacterium]MBT5119753.1 CvpA family protein [Planctomycetota bacterium]MBT7012705.1 CvpA family protein [Planctomycetota bacterium]